MSNWIKINRDIQSHWIFSDADRFKAWCVMLMTVNYKDNSQLIEGELIECKRGQSIVSIGTWVKKFGGEWTPQKVKTFFKLLEKDSMITREGLRKTTRVTICNYEAYQGEQLTDNSQITKRKLTDNSQITTTKEGKEVEEIKNKETHSKEHEDKPLSNEETFKAFWNHYHEITGKPKKEKSSAFKYWKKLNLTDQRKAYTMVKPLSLSNVDKDFLPYARTYLSGRSFDNEFIIAKPKIPAKETYEETVSRICVNQRQEW